MRLALSAFVTGFATLGLEITALRLLAPAFGSNILVFSNVVGVVLAGLAAGAWLGGRWADRRADSRRAGVLLLVAGVLVALLPSLAHPLLDAARRALVAGSAPLFFWSLAAVTLLVLPPTVLLGAVAPHLVRLRVGRVEEVGRVSGSLSSLGTAGSLLGTFLPTLVTIPFLGTAATLRILGAVLILGSALLVGWGASAALAFPLVLALAPLRAAGPGVLEERDSVYQHVLVEERPDGTRLLLVNEGLAVQSTWKPGNRLSGTSYDAFVLLDAAKDGGIRSLLDLGLAGGTIVHAFRTERPDVAITGVEIDPVVLELARRHFDLDGPDLAIREEDARAFLARTRRRFGAIAVDVFRGPHVPFHCATREFFALARSRLEPGGAVMMNVAVLSAHDRALTGLLNTVASVFAETRTWHPEGSKNWFVLASDTP
ncbi:MAG TPA: fused MFS/spermidine synthase, partial [Thermoanaerobaculia bacterium]|nr:fused MFS/spermidine synthase [Thermoanaerobaculia bacterium]